MLNEKFEIFIENKLISSTIPGEIFGKKWRNPVKLDKKIKIWYQILCVF